MGNKLIKGLRINHLFVRKISTLWSLWDRILLLLEIGIFQLYQALHIFRCQISLLQRRRLRPGVILVDLVVDTAQFSRYFVIMHHRIAFLLEKRFIFVFLHFDIIILFNLHIIVICLQLLIFNSYILYLFLENITLNQNIWALALTLFFFGNLGHVHPQFLILDIMLGRRVRFLFAVVEVRVFKIIFDELGWGFLLCAVVACSVVLLIELLFWLWLDRSHFKYVIVDTINLFVKLLIKNWNMKIYVKIVNFD